tara:strand:- start:8859 stop:9356 length:498 start_codon:yes stop_codon:yes gene_type:complete
MNNTINEVTNNILQNDGPVFMLGPELTNELVQRAGNSDLRRARVCLHRSPDSPVQEMIIAFAAGCEIPLHRHLDGKTESFHVLKGRVSVFLFDDSGNLAHELQLGDKETGLSSYYHLSTPYWHTLKIHGDHAIIHEVATGPWEKSNEKPPEWWEKTKIKIFRGND